MIWQNCSVFQIQTFGHSERVYVFKKKIKNTNHCISVQPATFFMLCNTYLCITFVLFYYICHLCTIIQNIIKTFFFISVDRSILLQNFSENLELLRSLLKLIEVRKTFYYSKVMGLEIRYFGYKIIYIHQM